MLLHRTHTIPTRVSISLSFPSAFWNIPVCFGQTGVITTGGISCARLAKIHTFYFLANFLAHSHCWRDLKCFPDSSLRDWEWRGSFWAALWYTRSTHSTFITLCELSHNEWIRANAVAKVCPEVSSSRVTQTRPSLIGAKSSPLENYKKGGSYEDVSVLRRLGEPAHCSLQMQ